MTPATFLLLSLLLQSTRPTSQPATLPAIPRPRPFAEADQLPAPRAGTVRVYVVRHGESVANATGDDPRLSDAEKDRLSERGRAQATAAGQVLQRLGVARLCHSPAVRARESAELAAQALPARPVPQVLPAFGPLVYGTAPGSGQPATAALTAAWSRGEDLRLPGGENLAAMTARLRPAVPGLATLAAKAQAPVALFAHGETLAAWLAQFQEPLVVRAITAVRLPNTTIAAFDVTPDGATTCVGLLVPPAATSRPAK